VANNPVHPAKVFATLSARKLRYAKHAATSLENERNAKFFIE
jgi:hypothetical protein